MKRKGTVASATGERKLDLGQYACSNVSSYSLKLTESSCYSGAAGQCWSLGTILLMQGALLKSDNPLLPPSDRDSVCESSDQYTCPNTDCNTTQEVLHVLIEDVLDGRHATIAVEHGLVWRHVGQCEVVDHHEGQQGKRCGQCI